MSVPSSQKFVLRDPEAFFKAQKRNRRATWRMSALCVFAAIIMGIPLTLVLTPLLYGATLIAADIINRFSPLPPEFWQTIDGLSKLFGRVADYLINQRGRVDPQELAIGLALTLLPGMVFAFVLWVGMRMLFRHGGVGGTLASLGARDPNPSDLKELQLSDVVQEMAIAAGLPAPKLMLIDSGGANAAAIGTSPDDARIVISRRLLDDLDRDQLQAILAAQVASIGNGDLSIAFTVTSVFEACGMIVTLINSPFGSQSRSTLWRVIRYAFKATSQDRAADAAEVADMLSDTLDVESTDINKFFEGQNPGFIKKFFRILFFPMALTNVAVEITLFFFLNVCLGPCMALLWRTRRYLGDAGAVELTRNPDALARALQRLSEDNNAMEGAEWASHLFAVNPKGDISLSGLQPSPAKMAETIAAWKATGSAAGSAAGAGENAALTAPAAFPGEWPAIRQEMMAVGAAAVSGDAKAAQRMHAFAVAMGGDPGMGLSGIGNMPSPQDIALAQKGDKDAIARIQALRPERRPPTRARHGTSGLQTHSFLSFHPPLAKRAKRLQKMGSTLVAPGRGYGVGTTILMVVLYAIVGPLLAAAGVMMLLAIAIMIGLNLMFLTLWLTIIHWAFGQNWTLIFNGIARFVNDFITAINKARR